MRKLIAILVFLLSYSVISQDGRYLDREISLLVDNDAFTLNLYLDQYYSQGVYARYRVVDTTGRKKTIRGISLNHRIFTNQSISLQDTALFERPFAGTLSLTFGKSWFSETSILQANLELGVMGKASLAEPIQKFWHRIFDLGNPIGWRYQINNSPLINGQLQHVTKLNKSDQVQLLSESNLSFGTIFNYVRQELVLRFGKMRPLNKSIMYGSNLGYKHKKSKNRLEENYFIAIGPEWVLYNSTIEGNLIGEPSVHTEERVPWIIQFRVGAQWSWSSFDLSLEYHWRSKETTIAENHKYVGILMAKRF